MADPLAGYTTDWRNPVAPLDQTQAGDPLAGYNPNWRDAMAGQPDARLGTAVGRSQVESEGISRQIAMLQKLIPTTTGVRQTTMKSQLAALQEQNNPLGTAPTLGESLKRVAGGAAEAIPQGFLGITDMAATALQGVDKALSLVGVNDGQYGTKAREQIHEAQASLSEMTGAKGWEGIVGNLAGSFGAGSLLSVASKLPVIGGAISLLNAPAEVYGAASNATLRFIGKGKLLQPAMTAALEGGRLQRAAGQVLGDLPLNITQALTQPDANIHDIARTLAIGAAGSMVGGSVKDRDLFAKGHAYDTDFSKPPSGNVNPDLAGLAQTASSINDWQKQNPTRQWADLDPTEQQAILNPPGAGLAVRQQEPGMGWTRVYNNTDGMPKYTQISNDVDNLRGYIMGEHNDFDGANDAWNNLQRMGLSSESMVSMLGLKPQIVNGNVVLVAPDGTTPNPQRLLLASGQAPKALVATARDISNTDLDKPTVTPDGMGNHDYVWDLPTGGSLAVTAIPVDGTLIVHAIVAHGGPMPGPRAIMAVRDQLMQMTGTNDIAGFRISGARDMPDIATASGNPPSDAVINAMGSPLGFGVADRSKATGNMNRPEAMSDPRTWPNGDVSRPADGVSRPGTDLGSSPKNGDAQTPLALSDFGPVSDPDTKHTFLYNWEGAAHENDPSLPEYEAIAKQHGWKLSDIDQHEDTLKDFWQGIATKPLSPDEAQSLADSQLQHATPEELDRIDSMYDRVKGNGTVTAHNLDMLIQAMGGVAHAPTDGPAALQVEVKRLISQGDLNAIKAKWSDLEDQLVDASGPSGKWLESQANLLYQHLEANGGINPAEDFKPGANTKGPDEPLPNTTQPATTPNPANGAVPAKPNTNTAPPLDPATPSALESIHLPAEQLAKMGPQEVMQKINNIAAPFNADESLLKTPAFSAAQRDIYKLNQRLKDINGLPPEARFALDAPVDGQRLAELSSKPLSQLKSGEGAKIDELGELNVLLQNANGKLPPGDPRKGPIVDKLMELRDFQRAREVKEVTPELKSEPSEDDIAELFYNQEIKPKGLGKAGFTLPSAQAAIVAHGAGFILGTAIPTDSDKNRLRNGLLGAALVGGAYMGAFYMKGKARLNDLESKIKLPGEENIDKVMKSVFNDPSHVEFSPDGMVSNLINATERFYMNTLRPSLAGEKIANILALGSRVGKQVGEMMASFGRWKNEATNWLYSGPMVQDGTGNWTRRMTTRADGTQVQVPSIAEILKAVNGDHGTLGKTSLGLSALERYNQTGKMPHPSLDPIQVSRYVSSVDPSFVQAAQSMRDLHLGLLDRQVESGLISPDARAAMASEQYYTAMERVFGGTQDAAIGKDIASRMKTIFSPTGVKSRVGPNDYTIRNPVETLISNIPRVAKAVELNEKKAAMIALWEASNIPNEVKKSFMQPIAKSQADRMNDQTYASQVQMLKSYLPDLTADQASSMVAAFDPEPLGPKSDKMTFLRNGNVETWKLAPDLTNTFQYMQGQEISKVWQVMGLGSGVARAGTMLSPDFVSRIAWFDMFHSYLNSHYGGTLRDTIPGVNWVDALYKGWTKSPEYKLYGGGSATGTYFEGTPSPASIMKRAAAQGDNYTQELWNHVKSLNIGEAYKTILTPVSEAGRFSEYLSARRHGAGVQEAVRSANAVIGYYNQVGPYAAGLFHAVPFAKGTLQSIDQAIAASGLHPFRQYDMTGAGSRQASAMRWFSKGMASIALPTAILYAANHGDKDIEQLRQSENGRRFWFMRGADGVIHSVRKPAGPDGGLFGAGVEIALDKMAGSEPEAFSQWVTAMKNELSIPYLPPAIQVAGTLGTGTELGTGNLMTPQSKESLPADMQISSGSSPTAQMMSKGLVNTLGEPQSDFMTRAFSPTGIQYISRTLGGTLGNEAFKLADASKTWAQDGHVPAVQELPIIRKFAGVDMTTAQTRDMEDFYNMVARAEKISNAMSQTQNQGDVEGFMSMAERYKTELGSASMLIQTRQQVSELQRAIAELKVIPGMDDTIKRQTLLSLRQQMQIQMSTAVQAARGMQ